MDVKPFYACYGNKRFHLDLEPFKCLLIVLNVTVYCRRHICLVYK